MWITVSFASFNEAAASNSNGTGSQYKTGGLSNASASQIGFNSMGGSGGLYSKSGSYGLTATVTNTTIR